MPLVPVGGGVLGLVLLGGDLGTAVILAAILGSLLWVAGAPARLFALALAPAGLLVMWMVNSHSYRMRRITDWLHPEQADPLGAGLQALHGKFALASGGWWGVGLGGSKEKWGALPEAHTDFIFAIIGEELGLVGTLAVLGLFGAVGYAGLRIALAASEPFVRLRRGRCDGLDPGAGDGQHRGRARAAADHGRAAAAGLLRRVGARADHARHRHAAVLRPGRPAR